MTDVEREIREHKDRLRGRLMLALHHHTKITAEVANTVRCSPMAGMAPVTLAAISECREQAEKMLDWLRQAEESAHALDAAEAALSPQSTNQGGG